MSIVPFREFKLSRPGVARGVSCDASGAYIDSIPLLKRTRAAGRDIWEPRNCIALSDDLSSHYDLPIDFSPKAAGLLAIANSLNGNDVVRAQLVTLHLQFPEPPTMAKATSDRDLRIKFIRDLDAGGLIKAGYKPDQPRWPAKAPNSQGGRWSPQGSGGQTGAGQRAPYEPEPSIGHNQGPPLELEEKLPFRALGTALLVLALLVATTQPAGKGEDEKNVKFHWHHAWPKYLGGIQNQVLARLPKALHDAYHRELDEVAPRREGTEYYDNMSRAEKTDLLRKVGERTKEFDAKYGTKLYKAMLKNGFPEIP